MKRRSFYDFGLSAGAGAALLATAVFPRGPHTILVAYLCAVAALVPIWGLRASRAFRRAISGTVTFALLFTLLAFVGMALPNAAHERLCGRPGVYCEDFSAALLGYACPFVLVLAPVLTCALHATCLAIAWLLRRRSPNVE